MTTRLQTIANRQKQTRVRDAFFAVAVAIAALVSITTVSSACEAASSNIVGHR